MNKKPTVCIMLPSHFTSKMGGAEYQALLLTDALQQTKRYKLYYVCARAENNNFSPGYQIRVVNNGRFTINSIFQTLYVYKELKKIAPDVIYQNVGGFMTGVAGYYSKKNGVPFIWHIASDDDIIPQWKSNIVRILRNLPQRLFLNYGLKNATVIAAQTKFQTKLLKRKFGIECHDLIPIGHPFPNKTVTKTFPITVLWIANLKPLKRPELFVRLAHHFRCRDGVRFVMIGRKGWGKWFKRLEKEIQQLPNLDYVGELSQEQVNDHLSQGHILVNTSRYEGFSNTFVQGWMRKVPVVSLSVDPDQILVKEKIGYKSESFEQLCKDLESVINDSSKRERMGERARRYAYDNHSVEKMTGVALKLLDNILRNGSK